MRSLLTLSALAGLGAAQSCSGPTPDDSLTVDTTSGLFTGYVNSSTPDVNVWLGVPFASPPVGSQRFLPPLPALYHGAVNATSYRDICYQDSTHTGVFWLLTTPFQNVDPQSEDCLYLNIWAPRKPVAKKVPVLIWVCGGGYNEGGGHAPYQVPDNWVQRMQTHIVITFNYRLNVFGFPGAKAAPWNAGLMDVRMVVEWAYNNIEGFGGDRDRMVLWGQSAGAGAVDSYAYAHPKDAIVSGLIADSGSASLSTGPAAAGLGFSTLAGIVGCGNMNASAELDCMQGVPATMLQNVLQGPATTANNVTVPRFGPQTDNVTVFANNTDRIAKGLVATVPLITGNNVNEGAAFAPFALNETAPPPAATLHQGLQMLACPVAQEVAARTNAGLTTYRYLFAGNFSNITPRYWLGAMHSSELPIVFGTHFEFNGNSTELEYETSYAMEDFWVSFLTNSSAPPTDSQGLTWPKYTGSGSQMVLFGNETGGPAQLVADNYYDAVYQCPSTTGTPRAPAPPKI